jgi:short-subunit dehydrogenase
MIPLKDKKVVIVGASSGIGEALARRCVDNGAKVYLLSRSAEKLLKVQ